MITENIITENNKGEEQVLNNIPTNSFISDNEETRNDYVQLKQKTKATLQLSNFAIIQFIHGAKLMVSDEKDVRISRNKATNLVKLMSMLTEVAMRNGKNSTDTLFFERKEVILMREMLEARMSHCEKERDERSDKFNADTYIGQKLLLLDIREWLLGEVVE